MTPSDNTDQDLREQLQKIMGKTDEHIQFAAIHGMPWTKGNLVNELEALFTRYKDEAVREARVDEALAHQQIMARYWKTSEMIAASRKRIAQLTKETPQ